MKSAHGWPVWKTIQLGINQDTAQKIISTALHEHSGKFIEKASQQRFSVDPDAWVVIKKPEFTLSDTVRDLQLTIVTLNTLGLQDGCCYADIFAAAKKAGLSLCPAEAGLQLRLQYMDQPYEETLVIAMQPIEDEDSLPSVFTVHHWDWGIGLGIACCGRSNIEDDWHADSDWVFMVSE